jgi:hypothetical protein
LSGGKHQAAGYQKLTSMTLATMMNRMRPSAAEATGQNRS